MDHSIFPTYVLCTFVPAMGRAMALGLLGKRSIFHVHS